MIKKILKKSLFCGTFFIIASLFFIIIAMNANANYSYPPRTYFGYSYAENDLFSWEYYKYGPNFYMYTGCRYYST